MTLTDFQEELCTTSRWDFSDLRALYVNCTRKPSPQHSNTEGISTAIIERNGAEVDFARAVDLDLAPVCGRTCASPARRATICCRFDFANPDYR
jgi:hypothetical protein